MIEEALKNNTMLIVLVLQLITKNANNFNNELSLLIPEISNEILSYSVNSNCSCREKIQSYIYVFSEKIINFVKKYSEIEENKNLIESVINNIQTEPTPQFSLSGKVAKTTLSKWDEFSKNILNSNSTFESFSVVKEGDSLLVFFI